MTVDIRRKTGKQYLWMVGMAGAALLWVLAGRESTDNGTDNGSVLGNALKISLAESFKESVYEQFLPIVSFAMQDTPTPYLAHKQVTDIMPFYGYAIENIDMAGQTVQVQIGEGQDTGKKDSTVQIPETPEEQKPKDVQEMLEEQKPAENQEVPEELNSTEIQELPEIGEQEGSVPEESVSEMTLEELMIAENQGFVPHRLQNPIELAELSDYETLVEQFYTIDAGTMAGSDQLDAEMLASHDLTIEKGEAGPQILIYHTHSQEFFADSVPGDASTSIVGVGECLATILEEEYGYQVLHHTGEYDVESRNDAYSVSLPAIEQVLKENPTIEVIIDLHRDQMPEETKLVMDLDGRPTARFMFFNGLSRTKTTGNIGYLYNEYQEENLAFSFQMQLATEQYYPGLARKIYLKGYRYNMHLKPRTLLIELGAQNNTVEEAMNACDPIAHVLHMVLGGEG